MGVVDAVTGELKGMGDAAESSLAATALSLARELDDGSNSATSKSMCAKALVDVLKELRALAPPRVEEDEVERARKRRVERLARQSTAGSSSSS